MQKLAFHIILVFFGLLFSFNGNSQEGSLYHFSFLVTHKAEINHLTQVISIDQVIGKKVFAYANQKEFAAFKKLKIPYEIIPEPKNLKSVEMASTLAEIENWDKYPTYDLYIQLMEKWASDYSGICELEEIGTLASDRKLLAIKISDNITNDFELEPELFVTSSMHGDELGGFGVSLQLIDYLLYSYQNNTDSLVVNLINSAKIWINPLANPDGSYFGGNHTVANSIRTNANYIDINRNFPDLVAGENPDGNARQEETQQMMDFAGTHHFVLSANIHSGAEVINYPWDTWSKLAADDTWWQYVGGNYRDSAQANSPAGYMTDINNGLTNGYKWYRITGGRQDYMNYFHNCREFTIEISNVKKYPSDNLPDLWNYNKNALLSYLNEGLNGIHGKVTGANGNRVEATIEILGHDIDHSEVYSVVSTGYFSRLIKSGTYSLKISANGYADKFIKDVKAVDGQQVFLDIVLSKSHATVCFADTLINKEVAINTMDSINVNITNCGNDTLNFSVEVEDGFNKSWVFLADTNYTLLPNQEKLVRIYFDGFYTGVETRSCNLLVRTDSVYELPVEVEFVDTDLLQFNSLGLQYQVSKSVGLADTVYLINNGFISKSYGFEWDKNLNWLHLENGTGVLNPGDSAPIVVFMGPEKYGTGFYKNRLVDTNGNSIVLPVSIIIDSVPKIQYQPKAIALNLAKGSVYSDTLRIKNRGGGILNYNIELESPFSWLTFTPKSGAVQYGNSDDVEMVINTEGLSIGKYINKLLIGSENDTVLIPINIFIDSLPKLNIENHFIESDIVKGKNIKIPLEIVNTGGGVLHYEILSEHDWLKIPDEYGLLRALERKTINILAISSDLQLGMHTGEILINDQIINVELNVQEPVQLELNPLGFYLNNAISNQFSETLLLTNSGQNYLEYEIRLENSDYPNYIQLNAVSGILGEGESVEVGFEVDFNILESSGEYKNYIEISSTSGKFRIPVELIKK